MDKSIGFAIIGTGSIGQVHAKSISGIEGAHVAVGCSIIPQEAKQFAEQNNSDWCEDFHEAIHRDDVQVVSICTPSALHLDPALAAFKAGKHVLVEKPMEITLEKADQMIEAADKYNCKLSVIFQSRFNPDMQWMKKMVDEGKLGKITMGEASLKWYRSAEYYKTGGWRGTWAMDGGGAVMNQGIHWVDLLQWMMGPVDTVYANCGTLIHDIEVEDTAIASVKFKNGALATIQVATSVFPGMTDRLEISGNKGTLYMETQKLRAKYFADEDGADVGFYGNKFEDACEIAAKVKIPGSEDYDLHINDAKSDGHNIQIKNFVECVRDDKQPFIDGPEGRKSLALICAIYESAKTGKVVKL